MEIRKEKHECAVFCKILDVTRWEHSFHWHENFEICQLMDKGCSFLIDGQKVEAEAGDIISINRRSVHRFIVEGKNVNIRILQFPIKSILNLEANITPIKPHITKKELQKNPKLESLVNICLEEITAEAPLEFNEKNPYILSIIDCLYFTLAKNFPDKSGSREFGASRLFFNAVEYVNQHFCDEDITVESVAKHLYVSREKISTEFIKYAGASLKNYISELRIKEVNLLLDSGFDIGNAAMKCGFNNLRTFNYTYKRVIGMTPTEYLNSKK